MKSILFLAIVLLSLSFQSCKDNLSVPTPASRNYQQDAAVLNEFVDIISILINAILYYRI